MKKALYVYKPVGISPLDLINRVKKSSAELAKEKIGYAGRLDPMAKGIVLLLVGDENKKRKEYEKLPKTYETDAIFGVQTDTYDILGKVITCTDKNVSKEHIDSVIQKKAHSLVGTREQPYPPYSSVRVHGKSLFYWARHNKIGNITIPSKKITIFDFKFLSSRTIPAPQLHTIIVNRIATVQGDFRQTEIREGWKTFFETRSETVFTVHRYRITCSGGTYIRSLVNSLGEESGHHAVAYDITRTHIGEISLNETNTV